MFTGIFLNLSIVPEAEILAYFAYGCAASMKIVPGMPHVRFARDVNNRSLFEPA